VSVLMPDWTLRRSPQSGDVVHALNVVRLGDRVVEVVSVCALAAGATATVTRAR
jgi:hypothetical protein